MSSSLRICLIALSGVCCLAAAAPGPPTNLRCEYQTNPLAVDTRKPRLSWWVNDQTRGAAQSAYQVRVASSKAALAADKADIWDSGKTDSSQSVNVCYAGPRLRPGEDYHWQVRAWDLDGHASEYSETASWRMGFLSRADWSAKWIRPAPEQPAEGDEKWQYGNWIWRPQDTGNDAVVYLRRAFELPPASEISAARIRTTADNSFELYVNGRKIGEGDEWEKSYQFDVKHRLQAGRNLLAVRAANDGGPCAFRLSLRLQTDDGQVRWIHSDDRWIATDTEASGWTAHDFDDSNWVPAEVLGPYGSEPWGAVGDGTGPLRSMLIRKDFTLPSHPARAILSICGLGAYEPRINGQKAGKDVMPPGWTDFEGRVQYQTYDVTNLLQSGKNAIAVILGNGWWKGRIMGASKRRDRDAVRLIAQLDIEYPDGSAQCITTDPSWRTTESPITANDIYDGETYDARLNQPGWDRPGFDDSNWRPTATLDWPSPKLLPQAKQTIQPFQELRAQSINEVKPGVFVYDFGQNLTGWCRLQVSGQAGDEVTLRHAEVLNPDGTIYTANLRSAKATDRYILAGRGTEVWEPRFTYHGFRYVEVTGYPGTPDADPLVARASSTAAPQIGQFQCSNQVINDVQHCIMWGLRGNMWAVPTDCPQRDERLGWTGDAQAFCNTSCWNADMDGMYSKWMADFRDCQGPNGEVPNVVPGGGTASPAWGDACIIVPWHTYRHYGDLRILWDNWDLMTDWVDYMTRHLKRGVYQRDGYGDWIAVVGSPKKPISAAYYYYDCLLLSKMARAMGKSHEAQKYAEMAAHTRDAFNARYFDWKANDYPGGTQTAKILPLHFGLVPRDRIGAVADNLARDIIDRDSHLSTGFLGTAYLNPVLTQTRHHDLAWRLATQTTYPSWGYMPEHGATTIWELWNSDKAGPGMNSRNHFCLGSVGEWFYTALAGINIVDAGFRTVRIHPQPAGELQWVEAGVETPYGPVVSNWRLDDGDLLMHVQIPPNSSGEIWVPTFGTRDVTISESGKVLWKESAPRSTVSGLQPIGRVEDRIVFEARAGKYNIRAKNVGKPSGLAR